MPLVSVCIQTYQQNNYIKECLDAVISQKTNFRFEIILGEDESNDGTREICIEYGNKHPDKIRLFLRSRKDVIFIDGKPTGRYNFIENLKASKGKYIALCEGDDYWTDPYKLQKQVDFLENNSDHVACCHNAKIDNKDFSDSWKKEAFYNPPGDFQNIDINTAHVILNFNIPTASLLFKSKYMLNTYPHGSRIL